MVGCLILVLFIYVVFFTGGGAKPRPTSSAKVTTSEVFPAHSPLNPNWTGSGKPVTLAFGGDVHFAGDVGVNLQEDPSTALGTSIPNLFSGAQLSMINLESTLTAGSCPEPQTKPYIFYVGPPGITALQSAGVTLAGNANDHSLDCGQQGLSQGLTVAAQTKYPVIGIGANAQAAFAPYRETIHGQRIAIIAATQSIASNLVSSWTATPTQAGVASAIDPTELIHAVQTARRTSDTVVVYLHWGTETQGCPDTSQTPWPKSSSRPVPTSSWAPGPMSCSAGATSAAPTSTTDWATLPSTNNDPPESNSGALLVTVTGRKVVSATFRPASDVNGVPQPLSGSAATTALTAWAAERGCTGLGAGPTSSQATNAGETKPFVAPATTPTTAPTSSSTTSTTSSTSGSGSSTTTTTEAATTTTVPQSTTTSPTDNAG